MKVVGKVLNAVVWATVGVAVIAIIGFVGWCDKHLGGGA
jgi:hypothetical protein